MRPVMLPAAASLAVLGLLAARPASGQTVVRFSVSLDGAAVPGRTIRATVAADIDAGWHLYALTEPAGGPVPLTIAIAPGGPFALAGAIVASPVTRALDPNFNIETEFHEDHATFVLPVRVAAGTPPGSYDLTIAVGFQTCNDRMCLPPEEQRLTAQVRIGRSDDRDNRTIGQSNNRTIEQSDNRAIGRSVAAAATTAGQALTTAAAIRVPDLASASAMARSVRAYVGLAAAMGALSLVTPCVFPMVPITVSYFTNRAGRGSRRGSVLQALTYGAGIILTFTALGFVLAVGFGASGVNRFAANPWLNLGVAALFVAFASSLFGVLEPALPSRLVTAAARADRGAGRYAGTLLMGLAFTLTSFTCTAPFLGTLFVVASQGEWQWPLLGMLVFSAVFALPFVVLALAPGLVAALPRSGAWLQSVKVTMGLLELAAAMKFLSNVDLVWGWGVFTRPVVLWTWIAIGVVLAFYLAGLVGLGPVRRLPRPRAARLAAALAAAAIAVWLSTGLSGRSIGEMEAFLPPADVAGSSAGGELRWIVNDYPGALQEARRQNRPVLIDFTGYTCTNCRWMETNLFPRPDIARELARFVRVRLYTDGQGDRFRAAQAMQQQMFGTVALPYYAVVEPTGRPVVAFGGLTRSADEYVAFLKRGLE